MTAELKNWVFEWIGRSSRSMGENDSQSKHIMGAVGAATRSAESSAGAGARGSADPNKGNKSGKDPTPKGGGQDQGISAQVKQVHK
ncbi:hypothetical protein [Ghiorsea bivora]|uniref:hypothetical protein n=1 Tax=Ghiorsea bivora TaxID=1485545 RepID=UPI000571F407|nr:hypothetical protein [Ghiorsea bivora]